MSATTRTAPKSTTAKAAKVALAAARTTDAKPRAVKLIGNVYATPTGFRVGLKGKVVSPSEFLRSLPLGERRPLRKAAFAAGCRWHAAADVRQQ